MNRPRIFPPLIRAALTAIIAGGSVVILGMTWLAIEAMVK